MTTIPVPTTPTPPSAPAAINPAVTPAVAKSIARPDAFSKAGSMGKTGSKSNGMRFRALKSQRGPGRPRKHARDVRNVLYY